MATAKEVKHAPFASSAAAAALHVSSQRLEIGASRLWQNCFQGKEMKGTQCLLFRDQVEHSC